MADLSSFSDEELARIAGGAAQTPKASPWASMSDEDLMRIAGQAKQVPPSPLASMDPISGLSLDAYRPQAGGSSRMFTDFENLVPAARQNISPNITGQKGQLVSSRTTTTETDEVLYQDPESGDWLAPDKSKHVVLRDPADRQLKVYARPQAGSLEIPEGSLTGISRVLAPGLSGGSVRGMVASPSVPRPGTQGTPAAEAAARTGVELPRVISSENFITQQTGAGLRNIPLIGQPIVQKTERAIEQMGGVVGDIAKAQGGATMEGAGKLASERISGWITGESAAKVSKAYDAVDEVVDPAVRTTLENTREAVADILARRQNAMLGDSKAVNAVIDAVQNPNGLNYQGVKDLRQTIREMRKKPQLLAQGMSTDELDDIYKGLTADLGKAAQEAGGQHGAALWRKANTLAAETSKQRKELASLVGVAGDASPAQVFERLKAAASGTSRADTELLTKARQTIGDGWDEVVSGVTTSLGQDAKGNFSPQIFLNNWSGQKGLSPAGKSILYGRGNHRASLDDIATISEQWPKLQKFANPSGTAQAGMAGVFGATMFTNPLGVLAAVMDPTTVAGLASGRLLAEILARPATASSAAAWTRAYRAAARSRSPGAFGQFKLASRNMANTVNAEFGTDVSFEDFMKAVQDNPPRSP